MSCKYNKKCEHRSNGCKSDNTIFSCTYGLNSIILEHTMTEIALKKKIKKLKSENSFIKTLLQTAMKCLGKDVDLSQIGESL